MVVSPEGRFYVRLQYVGDVSIAVDLTTYRVGPVFNPIKCDPKLFDQVRVDPPCGSVVWPNGAGIAPEALIALRVAVGEATGRTSGWNVEQDR